MGVWVGSSQTLMPWFQGPTWARSAGLQVLTWDAAEMSSVMTTPVKLLYTSSHYPSPAHCSTWCSLTGM